MTLEIKQVPDGVVLPIKIVPGSSKNRIAGLLGSRIKINIAAAPEKGKANKELIRFLAHTFNKPKSTVTIVAGLHDTLKQVHVADTDASVILRILNPFLKSGAE